MPGIFGFLVSTKQTQAPSTLDGMLQYHRSRKVFKSSIHFNDSLYAGYSQHFLIYSESQYFATNSNVTLWLDGEFYNQKQLTLKKNMQNGHDAEILLDYYCTDPSLKVLSIIDGIFTAVIFDKVKNKLIICTDRNGLQHIHWTKTKNYFAWATEYKAFCSLPDFNQKIDTSSLKDFLEYGYLIENRTWFENVTLLPPASILEYNIKSGNVKTHPYWSWDTTKTISRNVDIKEIAEEWGRLFEVAVNNRMFPFKDIGLSLSGGLDSRAILAAIPQTGHTLHALTFGEHECDDIKTARKIAAIKNATHHVCYLDNSSWLSTNLAAVWCSDGEICYLDTNGNEFLNFFSQHVKVSFTGLGGGVLYGGALHELKAPKTVNGINPYIYRDHRYIRQGFRMDESFFHIRIPFYDNALVEFIKSVPAELQAESFIYKKILLQNFPEYYRSIPWQKDGTPISYPKAATKIISLGKRTISRIVRFAEQANVPIKDGRNYINHVNRTKRDPGRSFFANLFQNKNALYTNFIDRETVLTDWNNHLKNKKPITMINRYATFEIWLQQIFEKKYRPQPDTLPYVDTNY